MERVNGRRLKEMILQAMMGSIKKTRNMEKDYSNGHLATCTLVISRKMRDMAVEE